MNLQELIDKRLADIISSEQENAPKDYYVYFSHIILVDNGNWAFVLRLQHKTSSYNKKYKIVAI